MLNGLVEHYASPTARTFDRLERFYQAPKNQGWKLLEELGTGFVDSESGFFLDLKQCRVVGAIAHDQVYAVFARSIDGIKLNLKGRSNGDTKYIPGMVEVGQQAETISGYKKNWNYNLYMAVEDGTSPSYTRPEFWANDDGSAPLPPAYRDTFCWERMNPGQFSKGGKVYSWQMVEAMTKPGMDARLTPQIIVYEKVYYKNYEAAARALQNALILKAPPAKYIPAGCSSSADCWLYHVDGHMTEEDNGFVANNSYSYAPGGWDKDFYNIQGA